MQDLMEMAAEAIRCRRERSPYFIEIIRELESAGLSSKEIGRLLKRAEDNMPVETTPTAA